MHASSDFAFNRFLHQLALFHAGLYGAQLQNRCHLLHLRIWTRFRATPKLLNHYETFVFQLMQRSFWLCWKICCGGEGFFSPQYFVSGPHPNGVLTPQHLEYRILWLISAFGFHWWHGRSLLVILGLLTYLSRKILLSPLWRRLSSITLFQHFPYLPWYDVFCYAILILILLALLLDRPSLVWHSDLVPTL